jgi:hypothetical protein
MRDRAECQRLEHLLEEAALQYFDAHHYVSKLDDSNPEKIWAVEALRGSKETVDEIQNQFDEHKAKHENQPHPRENSASEP